MSKIKKGENEKRMKPNNWNCPICKTINDIGQYMCKCNYYRGADKLRSEPGIVRDTKTRYKAADRKARRDFPILEKLD